MSAKSKYIKAIANMAKGELDSNSGVMDIFKQLHQDGTHPADALDMAHNLMDVKPGKFTQLILDNMRSIRNTQDAIPGEGYSPMSQWRKQYTAAEPIRLNNGAGNRPGNIYTIDRRNDLKRDSVNAGLQDSRNFYKNQYDVLGNILKRDGATNQLYDIIRTLGLGG